MFVYDKAAIYKYLLLHCYYQLRYYTCVITTYEYYLTSYCFNIVTFIFILIYKPMKDPGVR